MKAIRFAGVERGSQDRIIADGTNAHMHVLLAPVQVDRQEMLDAWGLVIREEQSLVLKPQKKNRRNGKSMDPFSLA